MKNLLLIALFGILFQPVIAQQMDSIPQPVAKDYNFYKAKQKRNRTAGWILLGSGLIIGTAGLAAGLADWTTARGEGAMSIGTVAMLGSIPLFLAAGKNKRRAQAVRL